MTDRTDELTRMYLQFCYNCQDAHTCDTEAQCLECLHEREQALHEEEQGHQTEELLKLYAF